MNPAIWLLVILRKSSFGRWGLKPVQYQGQPATERESDNGGLFLPRKGHCLVQLFLQLRLDADGGSMTFHNQKMTSLHQTAIGIVSTFFIFTPSHCLIR